MIPFSSKTPDPELDQPTCPVCRATMSLCHLQAHPLRDDGAELHSFECENCGINQNITVPLVPLPRVKSA
jgi:heterodisulfide reductase subunit A-like polyferredoxin